MKQLRGVALGLLSARAINSCYKLLTKGNTLDPWAFALELLISSDSTLYMHPAYLGEHLHLC